MWKCDLPKKGPVYLGIVAALQRDIERGRLTAGERLPAHRELARQLAVTVGTVSKAFGEAERRGLSVSRVGRGSYVLAFPEHVAVADAEPTGHIDLSVNTLSIEPFNLSLNRVLGALSRRKSLHALLEYHPVPGMERHRSAGAKWLSLRGIRTVGEDVILCNGAQEALMAVLATISRPGVSILTESLNYAGIQRLANLFRLDVRGVATDAHGLRPDALQDAAKTLKVGAILCSPTLHNPTNAIMSLERRRAVLKIAQKLDAIVIENDSYGHLSGNETPTLTALDPARCIYLCGTSKSIAPGLRIGYMLPPPALLGRLCESMHATSWTSPTLMGEIATILIEEGLAQEFVAGHRREARERMNISREILGDVTLPACPSYHLWLPLPEPWRAHAFSADLRARGVLVSPAEYFAVDRSPAPHAIRISLGGVRERGRLAEGLRIIAECLAAPARTVRSVA